MGSCHPSNNSLLSYFNNIHSLSDFVLVAVILLSHKFKMNPDNLATPLAASIGDVVSLSILSFIASLLFEHLGELECIVRLRFYLEKRITTIFTKIYSKF